MKNPQKIKIDINHSRIKTLVPLSQMKINFKLGKVFFCFVFFFLIKGAFFVSEKFLFFPVNLQVAGTY